MDDAPPIPKDPVPLFLITSIQELSLTTQGKMMRMIDGLREQNFFNNLVLCYEENSMSS